MIDPESTAHFGMLHASPPAMGALPQQDALHQAHTGFLATLDPNAITLDENFAIVIEDDDQFPIGEV